MERKLDGSSVEFDRELVGLLALGKDEVSVAVAVVVFRESALRSGVRWYWLVGE